MDADFCGGTAAWVESFGNDVLEERVAGATGVPPLANLESWEGLIIAVGGIWTRVMWWMTQYPVWGISRFQLRRD